jgi:hypothetical protein
MERETMIIKEDELQKYLDKWIDIFELHTWRIKAKIVRKADMDFIDSGGECTAQSVCKEAYIKLLSPDDWDGYFNQDMEQILVHELLHLVFAPLEGKDLVLSRVPHEILGAVNRAIIQAHRGVS